MNHCLKYRKSIDEIKTKSVRGGLGSVWRKPVYCPDGLRYRGGASLIQAFMWNVGTCRAGVLPQASAEVCRQPGNTGKATSREIQGRKYRYTLQGRTNS